jgi:hypothetical protein
METITKEDKDKWPDEKQRAPSATANGINGRKSTATPRRRKNNRILDQHCPRAKPTGGVFFCAFQSVAVVMPKRCALGY